MSPIVTSEVVCAEARGEAARRAEMHHMNHDRSAIYRDLTFEPVSEQEFRAVNPEGGTDLLSLVLDDVEKRLGLDFMEHKEGNGSVLVLWSPGT